MFLFLLDSLVVSNLLCFLCPVDLGFTLGPNLGLRLLTTLLTTVSFFQDINDPHSMVPIKEANKIIIHVIHFIIIK